MTNEYSEIEIEAKVENLSKVIDFVDDFLEKMDASFKVKMQIDIAVEEIFVNIAHYAYTPDTGMATVRFESFDNPSMTKITFIDRGKPYNPLEKEDPDITLSAEERQIGGLGIYMTKKSMDDITYEFLDGKNILTISKYI